MNAPASKIALLLVAILSASIRTGYQQEITAEETSQKTCITKGTAGRRQKYKNFMGPNAPYNVSDEATLSVLRNYCPNLFRFEDSYESVCCDKNQLKIFQEQITQLYAVIGRCTQCINNIMSFSCALACHPTQNQFITVDKVSKYGNSSKVYLIDEITVYVKPKMLEEMYASCKDVKFVNGGGDVRAVSFLCDNSQIEQGDCDGVTLVKSMLSKSPFKINLETENFPKNVTPLASFDGSKKVGIFSPKTLQLEMQKCHVGYFKNNKFVDSCSCQDCEDSCPPTIDYFYHNDISNDQKLLKGTKNYHYTMLLYYRSFAWKLAVIVIYIIFIFIFSITIHYYRKKKLFKQSMQRNHNFDSAEYEANRNLLSNLDKNGHDMLTLEDDENKSNITELGEFEEDDKLISAMNHLKMCRNNTALNNSLYFYMKIGIKSVVKKVIKYKSSILVFLLAGMLIPSISLYYFDRNLSLDMTSLWADPKHSKAYLNKINFDKNFGGFYRTQQVIFKVRNGTVFDEQFFEELFRIQEQVELIEIKYNSSGVNKTVTLQDICLKPLSPENNNCAVFSPLQYFQQDNIKFKYKTDDHNFVDHIKYCIAHPTSIEDINFNNTSCFSDFGAPVPYNMVFGGYTRIDSDNDNQNNDEQLAYVMNSTKAVILTYVLPGVEKNDEATKKIKSNILKFEEAFIDFFNKLSNESAIFDISFSTESSIQHEISKLIAQEYPFLLASFLLMTVYIAIRFSLPEHRPDTHDRRSDIKRFGTKFLLTAAVILITVTSIGTAVFTYCVLMKLTLPLAVLIFVAPLMLIMNVDSVFIINNYYYLLNSVKPWCFKPVDSLIAKTWARTTPNIIVTYVTAIFMVSGCYFILNIPIIRMFAILFSLSSVFSLFILIVWFVTVYSIDITVNENNLNEDKKGKIINYLCCFWVYKESKFLETAKRWVNKFKIFLTNCIAKGWFRMSVIFVFVTLFMLCLSVAPDLKYGIEQQKMILSENSKLTQYYNDLFSLTRPGAPVYFVIDEGYRYEVRENQNLICSIDGCDKYSLSSQIWSHARLSKYSKIATYSNNWIDGFFFWLRPDLDKSCCRRVASIEKKVNADEINLWLEKKSLSQTALDNETTDGLYRLREIVLCDANEPGFVKCEPCLDAETQYNGRPNSTEFVVFLPHFLSSVPNDKCLTGGKASYQNSVILNHTFYRELADLMENNITKTQDEIVDELLNNSNFIITSSFMTYHTYLREANDFVKAYENSLKIANNISSTINHTVYSYSVFYVYFEAFDDTDRTIMIIFCVLVSAVILLNLIYYNFNMTVVLIDFFVLLSIIVWNVGYMMVMNIPVNPVSLVILIMITVISVGHVRVFTEQYMLNCCDVPLVKCKTIYYSFSFKQLTGIMFTQLVGVIALAFAKSHLFKEYLFQLFIFGTFNCIFHSMLLLPVMMATFGPKNMANSFVRFFDLVKKICKLAN